MGLNLTTLEKNGYTVFQIEGNIHDAGVLDIKKNLSEILDKTPFLIIDFAKTLHSCSAILGLLLTEIEDIRKFNKGDIFLCNVNNALMKSMKLVGITDIIKIFDSVAAAEEHINTLLET